MTKTINGLSNCCQLIFCLSTNQVIVNHFSTNSDKMAWYLSKRPVYMLEDWLKVGCEAEITSELTRQADRQ